MDMLHKAAKTLNLPSISTEGLMGLYFPRTEPKDKAHSRVLKEKLGNALYLQAGWLDGIGVYKKSPCKAVLTAWNTHDDIFAFDHVPIKGSVRLEPQDSHPLKVWVGSV